VEDTPVTVLWGPNLALRPMSAWRYSHHFTNAYDGRLVLVTEHGWVDFVDNLPRRHVECDIVGAHDFEEARWQS